MRVAICIPVLNLGGTEVHTLKLAHALLAAGWEPLVCCYYEYNNAMVEQFAEAGVQVRLLRLSRSAGLLSLAWQLSKCFQDEHLDVVHVQYIAPGLVPVIAAKLAGVRTVFATVHQPGDRFGLRERLLFSAAARLCTAFFCVSEAVERSWFSSSAIFSLDAVALGRRHFTIYNGVSVACASEISPRAENEELRARLGLSGRRVIGVIGRLRAEKGHALLLNALPLVLNAVPDAILLVVGDGPDRATLEKQAHSLGIVNHVVWTGGQSPEMVRAFYGATDVVAIPSQFEGFGLTAAEAMAAGRPVVGTRVGGLAEVIEDGITGYLIPPGDTSAFAAAIIGLLQDTRKAVNMGERGRQRVLEHFSIERFAEAFVNAYRYFMKDGRYFGEGTGGLPTSHQRCRTNAFETKASRIPADKHEH